MLERKSRIAPCEPVNAFLAVVSCLIITILVSTGCSYAEFASAQPLSSRASQLPSPAAMARAPLSAVQSPESRTLENTAVRCSGSVVAEVDEPETAVQKACALIYQGKFDAADEFIKSIKFQPDSSFDRLAAIVEEYRSITKQRQSSRQAAYRERLDELEKLRTGIDSNQDVVADPNNVDDANDVSRITSRLSVIARVEEFADDTQKAELLAEPLVKQVFQEAMDKAAEFEEKGEWLEAYVTCYSWLQVIEEDNQAYSDYTEQLIDKAGIVASFQDSPCETRQERYKGVDEELFVKAIKDLDSKYVGTIDYRQMAAKAITRCRLLAEVVDKSFAKIQESMVYTGDDSESSFTKPDSQKLAAWVTALSDLQSQTDQSFSGVSRDRFIRILEKVLKLNKKTAKLPKPVLIAQFAEASLASLDPYTVMVWPRQVQDFEKIMTSEFTGVGIEISKNKGLLTVASLLPDTPAYNSGLDAEDVIEKVDGVPTKDMTLTCAVKNITGPAGTDVKLTIKRPGEEQTRDITITRARIVVPTIRGWQRTRLGRWLYMIDDDEKIGYVRITSFSEKTPSDLEIVLKNLEKQGMRALILDLRSNTGGLLDSAVNITDKFIKAGWIVRTRPRYGFGTNAVAHNTRTHPDYPLVILVNSVSASASEIVAGALADKVHKRAILVGERTHGKGSVQGIIPYLGGEAQLKYTMAYYILPSGQRVESRDVMEKLGREDWGVAPDIEIKLRSDEVKKRLEAQKDNDVLVKAGHLDVSEPLKKRTAAETINADPQLAVGILAVKTKLIEQSEKLEAKKKKNGFQLLTVSL